MIHHTTIKLATILLAIGTAMMPTLEAQEQQVTVQFVSFPLTNDEEAIELVIGEGETIQVELPTNRLSTEFKVPKLKNWVLGKTIEGAKEGEKSFDVFGEVSALASGKQLILVIRGGHEKPNDFTLTAFDGGQAGLTGGAYLFFNASKVDIAATVGESRFSLKPQAHKLISPKRSKEEKELNQIVTRLHFRKGEEAVPFYTSTWRFNEKARSLVFFYHDAHTKQLRTHTIRNYLP
jgi:hypothetical protein